MIGLFVPEKTEPVKLDIPKFSDYVGKNVQYSVRGRYAIKHIVKTLIEADEKKRTGVVMPAYFCPSVYECIRQIPGIRIYFADIDIDDLNISVQSLKTVLNEQQDVLCVIVASLYGNPADLVAISAMCLEHDVYMIDDAAQAWGAKCDGKPVGTFGNAGVWACSPGKPTGGHAGSLFWSDVPVRVNKTRRNMLHWMMFKAYCMGRRDIYFESGFLKTVGSLESRIISFVQRFVNIEDDECSPFEEKLLGGYFWGSLDYIIERSEIHEHFVRKFANSKNFRIVSALRGESHPCKLVLLYKDSYACKRAKTFFSDRRISWFGGYISLAPSYNDIPNMEEIRERVIELPIELNKKHMNEIEDAINECERIENEGKRFG